MYASLIGRLIRKGYAEAVAGDPKLLLAMAADDVEFTFPGHNSFAGTLRGPAQLRAWMARFASLQPDFQVHDVIVSGPPWHLRVAVTFSDAIGGDYRNDGVEVLDVRWGRLRRLTVHLDTEQISAWEARHPELLGATMVA